MKAPRWNGWKPDEVIEHIPQFCTCCGRDISHVHAELVESRQEVVLPVIQPIFIEHQAFQRTCTCGNTVIADFPFGITPASATGENVETLQLTWVPVSLYPFIGWPKCSGMFFNTPISEGALVKAINRVAKKSHSRIWLIRKRAETADVNGGDETGMKINGQKGWFWTLRENFSTFIIASLNRGAQTLYQHFPMGSHFLFLYTIAGDAI